MVDISETYLESERLCLRAWKEDDLDDFYTYASIEGVGEMAGWKHHENKAETKKILRMFINDKNCFAIVLKATNTVIGSIGLHTSWSELHASYQHLNCKEVGYV
ncbi:MAG: GNAT family N-acetyltransferase, partial [Erysipelotrichaceae bacterium]